MIALSATAWGGLNLQFHLGLVIRLAQYATALANTFTLKRVMKMRRVSGQIIPMGKLKRE